MNFIRSAFVFTFSITVLLTLSISAQNSSRVSRTWEVQRYDITATLPRAENERSMTVKAGLNLKNASGLTASTLTLRISQNAEILAIKLNDSTADFSKGEEKISNTSSLQRAMIRIPSLAPNSTISVAVDYKLNVKENSGLSALSPAGSQFLPLSFWYPTPNSWFFARGGDYAPFNLTVINETATKIDVVSSGESADSASPGKTTSSFNQKLYGQPFFVAGEWDIANSQGVSVFLPKGATAEQKKRGDEIAAFAVEAKSYFETLLGPAPSVPIKIVAVKRGSGFSGGGTVFVETGYFNRQKIDSQTAMNVAESIARIWLGNKVLIEGDGNGVIREGLVRYVATKFIEKKYGNDIADIERLRQRVAYAAVAKRDSPLRQASPLDDYYYASVSNKGAMVWRLLAKAVGEDDFFKSVRAQTGDDYIDLNEMRAGFSEQKELLDYEIDEVQNMNLMVGLPQVNGAETKSVLRNTGGIAVQVDVVATTSNDEKIRSRVNIPANGFGEAVFRSSNKIVRTEIDPEKIYPQTDYSDDIVPRNTDESDAIILIKRAFDKQDFVSAEKSSRDSLLQFPRFDDARVWLARALLAQGKITDAERQFRLVLDEKLPTQRSLAWANVGLGETAAIAGQKSAAFGHFTEAIKADAEYGATLAARNGRNKLALTPAIDDSIKAFFVQFDRAAVSGRKADVDSLVVSGEITKFAGGVSGAQAWQTKVISVDQIDANTMFAETELTIRLLNKSVETGTAVFQISRVGAGWKMSSVLTFEVR